MSATIAPPELPATDATEERLRRELEITWREPSGLWGWLTSVNHKSIGKRYIVTAFIFFLLGGLEAAAIRAQLSRPENTLLGPDKYNQIFTMHGTTMMFLFAVPMMTAVGLYLVPLMVGTRNVAFPRLNALGYWVYLFGGAFLYISFFMNVGPDAGWFAYTPLSGPTFSPGKRVDTWAQTITFTEIAGLIAAVNIIVTVFKMRAPGMSLNRVPLFVWAQVVISFQIIFAMPSVAAASMMLAADRAVDTHFFNAAEGGDALLWQHMFWFFGHPEVYIIFIPALGMISPIVAAFTRREVFGYPILVASMVATGFMSFGLWVHHMFAAPIPQLGQSFFTAASAMISIPTGVQIAAWIATIWAGRPRFELPFLWVLAFFVTFIIGGVTGVMLASIPFDTQVHDTFFVVAHLHYVLLGGAVFPLFGAFYFWFPKVTGRKLGETLGRVNFWFMVIGVNLTFFPMHQLGFEGMPRRVYTYLAETGWGPLNMLASMGAVLITIGVLAFLLNVAMSLKAGRLAGNDPWRADGLEWATTSPPLPWNYTDIPVVQSRAPMWSTEGEFPVVRGLSTRVPEVLITTMMDAEPDSRHRHPRHTVAPLATALAVVVAFAGAVYTPWGMPIGFLLGMIVFVRWAWPRHKRGEEERIYPSVVALPEHA